MDEINPYAPPQEVSLAEDPASQLTFLIRCRIDAALLFETNLFAMQQTLGMRLFALATNGIAIYLTYWVCFGLTRLTAVPGGFTSSLTLPIVMVLLFITLGVFWIIRQTLQKLGMYLWIRPWIERQVAEFVGYHGLNYGRWELVISPDFFAIKTPEQADVRFRWPDLRLLPIPGGRSRIQGAVVLKLTPDFALAIPNDSESETRARVIYRTVFERSGSRMRNAGRAVAWLLSLIRGKAKQ